MSVGTPPAGETGETTDSADNSCQLVLASRSPARTSLLSQTGIRHRVLVSHVDEGAVAATLGAVSPAVTAAALARAKAETVAASPAARGALVLGCDSVFEFDGHAYGKPGSAAVATERIRAMSGRTGTLHTGHWLVDTRPSTSVRTQKGVGALASATVHFAQVTERHIARYVATGEPLEVAGSFTLDGRGGVFIERVEGDPHAVVGVSLATVRELLAQLGVDITELWDRPDGYDNHERSVDVDRGT